MPDLPLKNTDISSLVAALNFFHPLSEGVIDFLKQKVEPVSFRRGELLLKAGGYCEYVYFIRSGVVRGFVKDNGKILTTWITAENELVSAISSLELHTPALESIEALEDCDMLAMHVSSMKELYEKHPEFNITGRKLLEKYYRDAERRALIVRLSNAEQKYRFFIENYSHLANRIQLKVVASFLGITLETLSRVRKKLTL